MMQYSAEEFRKRLAGLETPEMKFDEKEIETFKKMGVELILALRDVFGAGLDRKTVWERISNGLPVASVKSGGRCEKFFTSLIDYVKADVNHVIGSESLRKIVAEACRLSSESQKQFIRICVEYRMLLCLQAREMVEDEKKIKAQVNAKQVSIGPDGSIIARGVSQ